MFFCFHLFPQCHNPCFTLYPTTLYFHYTSLSHQPNHHTKSYHPQPQSSPTTAPPTNPPQHHPPTHYSTTDKHDSYRQVTSRVGIPLCRALLSKEEGDLEGAVHSLQAIMDDIRDIGGSDAQVFHSFLFEYFFVLI